MIIKPAFIALAAAVTLGSAFSQAAFAQSMDTPIHVSYADLNISTQAGAKTLLQRIHAGAQSSCGYTPNATLDRKRSFDLCVKDMTDHTVASLHNPVVTALNSGSAPTTAVASAK